LESELSNALDSVRDTPLLDAAACTEDTTAAQLSTRERRDTDETQHITARDGRGGNVSCIVSPISKYSLPHAANRVPL